MSRIEKIRNLLDEHSLDAFYITHIPNIRYITGFSGSSAYLLITKNKDYFFTDFRYKEQSAEQVKGFEIIVNTNPPAEVNRILKEPGIKNTGFESTRITYHQLETLKTAHTGMNFKPIPENIEKLTMQKNPDELAKIKKACEITDKVFEKILDLIKPGMKERAISAEISYMHKLFGAEKDSFDPIVASGWRGALPHGTASDKIMESGEMVTLDFGCVYEGFCSDMTRTISLGKPGDEMKKIYNVVLDSQKSAIDAAGEGITTVQLDAAARNYINNNGYEGKFGHGLGHGLGIEVHEMPSVSRKMDIKIPLNSVVTIEPGIYIEGLGGVRIEDDVIIKENGCEILNSSPKELIII